nr:hypothetical protein [uncultured Achromobacter sp.]
MPYVDPTGGQTGYSSFPQPGFNFIKWVEVAPESPVQIPVTISRFQGREAMWQTPHGDVTLFEAAETIINRADTSLTYKRAWTDLQEFRRDSEMLAAIAAMLGLSSAQVDALFILGASIQA